ncbi:MAG: DUF5666 domain-containing protein [Armatimonadota bacterium]
MYKKILVLSLVLLFLSVSFACAQQEQYFEGSAECAEVNAAQGILILTGQQGQRITIYVSPQATITNKITGAPASINNISPGDMVGVAGMANFQTQTIKAQKIIFLPQFKAQPQNSSPQTYPQYMEQQQQQGQQPQFAGGIVSSVAPQAIVLNTQQGPLNVVISPMTTFANGAEPAGQFSSISQIRQGDKVTVSGQLSGGTIQAMAVLFMHPGDQPHPSWQQGQQQQQNTCPPCSEN